MATSASPSAVGIAEIEAAARDDRAARSARRPVLPAREVAQPGSGCRSRLKAENLQRTGSFKTRGALNKVAALSADELGRGLVAASAGNHAQAVAVAARSREARALVVMPADAPLAKVEAVRGYGAEVRSVDGGYDDAAALARKLAARRRHDPDPALRRPARDRGPGHDRARDRRAGAADGDRGRPDRRRRARRRGRDRDPGAAPRRPRDRGAGGAADRGHDLRRDRDQAAGGGHPAAARPLPRRARHGRR